jgi:predicted flap endonuclease-1-like 5' DNA nuclease
MAAKKPKIDININPNEPAPDLAYAHAAAHAGDYPQLVPVPEERTEKVVCNKGDQPLIVNGRYLYPGETRALHPAQADQAMEQHPGLLVVVGEETKTFEDLGGSVTTASLGLAESGEGKREERSGEETQSDDLTSLDGVGEATARKLADAGITSFAALAEGDADDLADQTGLNAENIRRWQQEAGSM